MMRQSFAVAAATVLAATVSVAGCGSDSGSSGKDTVDVTADDKSCEVEKTRFAPGSVTFSVQNAGSDITEVYVYGEKDGDFSQIVNEVENIGPGTGRDMTVDLSAGRYEVACKPGMVGDGIRTQITVKPGADHSTHEGAQ